MKKLSLGLLLFLLILVASPVQAHPGRTDSSGCHTCRTNCPDWGLSYGEYHCHGGGSVEEEVVNTEQYYTQPTSSTQYYPTSEPLPTDTPEPTEIILPPTDIPIPTVVQQSSQESESDSGSTLLGTAILGGGGYWWYKRKQKSKQTSV